MTVIIETERLIIRTWSLERDLAPMSVLNRDAQVMEYFPALLDETETRAFIKRMQRHQHDYGYALYAVELKASGQFIGFVGLLRQVFKAHFTPATEIGWRLSAEYWGQGYAIEAAKAVMHYAFTWLELDALVSMTAVANQRSRRLMTKLGMFHNSEDDFIHPKVPANHHLAKHVLYRMTRDEYLTQNHISVLAKHAYALAGSQRARHWLVSLPKILRKLQLVWSLSNIEPVTNMTFHYVARGLLEGQQPIIIKIGWDNSLINRELRALEYFAGHGAVRVIDFNNKYNALLLEQAVPGTTLKALYPEQFDTVVLQYVWVMQQLHHPELPERYDHYHFPHIRDWLKALDSTPETAYPPHVIKRARILRRHLLATMQEEKLLHGDLHHDNILLHKDKWLAIDPACVIGETAFEVAAFDFISHEELAEQQALKLIFRKRVIILARRTGLAPQRIADWVYVRLVLAAAWFFDDNCPDEARQRLGLLERIFD
ncbi:MAG: hypothetical protein Tsb005_00380 [Gammaproteobacteria bacterium]